LIAIKSRLPNPKSLVLVAVSKDGHEDVVAVSEDPRGHVHGFADRPFDRKPPPVDIGTDVLDDDAA
jgi:hypothetical protein